MVEELLENLSNLKIENENQALDTLKYAINRTGLTYDPIMLEFYCVYNDAYPEKPDRIRIPYERCKFYNLIEKCVEVKGRFASDEEIETQHTKRINEEIKQTETMTRDELIELSKKYDSMFWHNNSNKAARWALGSSLELMDNILTNKIQNGFAIIRPPGHHAMADEPNGYCYFNNAAICAKIAIEKYNLKRILIVDWDVHHGQATQRMFYDDPRVVYFSIHRYDYGKFWPNLRESDFDYIGEGNGKGFNINVPLNKTGHGDCEYMAIFNNILLPIAYEFNPELVIISSGYDSCIGCFEGRMRVTPSCYAHFINALSCFANGKLCVLLEGGYCIKSLSEAVALTIRSLLGYPCPRLESFQEPDSSIVEMINNVKAVLRPYWCCLQQINESDSISLNEYLENYDEKRKGIQYFNVENPPKEFPLFGYHPFMTEEETKAIELEVDKLIENTDLSVPERRTCICTDDEMMRHHHLYDPTHPEKPERLKRIVDLLKSKRIYERCGHLKSRYANDDDLKLCHDEQYINELKQLKNKTQDELKNLTLNPNSVFYHWDSFECASLAVGCLLSIVDAVCKKEYLNGAAIIRPPGHHAKTNKASGFCFFNSVAIAAKYAQKNYNTKKILIVDFDVHHGNGTQDIFKNDDSILFISLHRYDNGCFYPLHEQSNYDYIGEDNGIGYTVNIPWNEKPNGDAEYISAFLNIIMPIAYQFNPDLVFVSAGFDAAVGDPLGGYKITPNGYAQMCKMLLPLANGRLILALEGGYNLISISESMCSCISVLLGDTCSSLTNFLPKEQAVQSIRKVISTLKPYWSALKFDQKLPAVEFVKKAKASRASNEQNNKTTEMSYSLRSRLKITEQPEQRDQNDVQLAAGAAAQLPIKDTLKLSTVNEIHAVVPLLYCPHLNEVKPIPNEINDINVHQPCKECNDRNENWICLTCYQVYCSRFVNGDMAQHYAESNHSMCLSFSDFSVWCFTCDAYVNNEILESVKKSAYKSKFNEIL